MQQLQSVLYGTAFSYVDVTHLVKKLCAVHNAKDGHVFYYIPKTDPSRSALFGDPLYGISKHIKLGARIFEANDGLLLDNALTFVMVIKTPRDFWHLVGQHMTDSRRALGILHQHLIIEHGSLHEEYPEQEMVASFLPTHAQVLELGGNIGRNSLVIASIADQLLVLESDAQTASKLIHNRDLNHFSFPVESSALSDKRLIQKGWETKTSPDEKSDGVGWTPVRSITYKELRHKYSTFVPDTLVVDCEGALYQILKDGESILDNIKLIIIENDYLEASQKRFVDFVFQRHGFVLAYSHHGGLPTHPCNSCFYQVFVKNV